ncbi:MAG: Flp pilus assembly protein CpaB [Planctomycetota bacterium]|nr:MAG: Flp pilus assembly protein CpaB [Planctomycetota bacterium]
MKSRAIIPLILGLGVGVFAVKMFITVLKKAKGASQANVAQVVRARGLIDATVQINESMIEVVEVPKAFIPADAFTDKSKVIGRVTNQMIPKGIPVLSSLLAPKGTMPGLTARIKEGARAVAVKIDEYAGVAGWLKPGCRVDVVVVMSASSTSRKTGGTISKVILQDVEVLAVGQSIETPGVEASLTRSVTLLVEPRDVPKLHLAATRGKLRLAMRGREDSGKPPSEITTDNDLLLTEGAGENQNKSGQDTLFSRMFAKQPKIDSDETDKDIESALFPMPATLNNEWVVEVLSGRNVYQIRFEDDSKNARKLGVSVCRTDQAKDSGTSKAFSDVQNSLTDKKNIGL